MSVVEFFSQPVWYRLSLTLVHFLWQGLTVAVIACALVRVLRLKRGNPRYTAYLVAFGVMTISPLLTFTVLRGAARPVPAPSVLNASALLPEEESSGPAAHSLSQAPPQPHREDAPTVVPTPSLPLRERLDRVLQASLPWALVGWIGGVLVLSVRLLLGFLGIRRWRRDLEPLTEDLETRVARLSERLGLPDFARVFTSRHAQEAVAVGYLRPMVLLPAAFATQMPPEMLEAVIAHELAHIRRLDVWVNLAQRVLETLLFYHPAVWWVSSRLRNERELCCDELAVGATGERLVYASALEQAGRVRLAAGQSALAVGFGQDRKSTLGRVRHVLGLPPIPADSHSWLAGVIAFLVLILLMMRVPPSRTARAGSESTPETVRAEEAPSAYALPDGWSLDYDDGLRPDGGQMWRGGMAKDLSSLEIKPAGLGLSDTSWKEEKYDFEVQSPHGERLGEIHIRFDRPGMQMGQMTLKPGKYLLRYTRGFGTAADNFRMHAGPFAVDLPKPGMYTLRFGPPLGPAEITGLLNGCYAVNFERIDGRFGITGLVYQNDGRHYTIPGLPPGTYRLSAVTQRDECNVFVCQAQATLGAQEKMRVDLTPPALGDCSLEGVILGKPGTYRIPGPRQALSDPQWFVLIRKSGSGPIAQTEAYEAVTMDSFYVVRGDKIVQEREDRATYSIRGLVPGEYAVTALEHPWFRGLPIERQQSKPLTLRAGERAVLDFELRVPTGPQPARAGQVQAKTDGDDLSEVRAKYEAAREASPHRYFMLVRNERNLWVAYRDGIRLYRAKYFFARVVAAGRRLDAAAAAQERAKAGDTISSLLAWANSHTPEYAEAYDGTQGASLSIDGYGRLQSNGKTRRPPLMLDFASVHTLQSLGWPDMDFRISSYRIVTSDRYALENGLICVEEQHRVTSSRDGVMADITRFYLNPAKDYLCQRMHEGIRDYAREVTKYGQTADGRWYPLQLDEFGNRSSPEPISDRPSAVDIVSLDTNPTFPESIFDPDALLARYASEMASTRAGTPPLQSAEPDASQRRVAGQVVAGDTGQPIGSALIRVAVPAADMRFTRVAAKQITQSNGTKSTIYETRTDLDGRFDLLVPGGGSLSLDALAPGYGTAAEHFNSDPTLLMLSNTAMSGTLRPNTSKLTIRLPRAAYIAGIAEHAQGAPAAGVPIRAQLRRERSTHHVASAETNAQGRFEIFDFPLQPQPGEIGELVFTPATAVPVTVSGLYDLSPEKLTSLEVVLPRGVKVTGIVLDTEGQAVAGVTVEATRESILQRQTTTDANGHFELAGLTEGSTQLRAHATGLDHRAVQRLDLTDHDQDITLKMAPVEIKGQLKPVRLFGMQLVDVTPEIKEVYGLYRDDGVLILDPGPDAARLGIGELKKGYCFWIIGRKDVSDLKEMVSELLRQLAPPWTPEPDRPGVPLRRVHVVYMARKGTSTKHMVLTPEDVAELRALAQKLGIAAAGN
jgi:beta-lactamase regulating signal transducer with metallopeptidase domain/5-hydroxyisourate hydrolase-like protein (transthyretin family)